MKNIHLIILVLLGVGCAELDSETDRPKLARVGEEILYFDEVEKERAQNLVVQDSMRFITQYTDKWIREQVIIRKAKEELNEESLNVENQLRDYEKSLVIYAYEKELIKKKLDTLVSNDEVVQYYEEHLENFKLQDYIVKVFYLKINKDAPKMDEVKAWYKLKNDEDAEKLLSYAPLHGVNYYFDDQKWVYFEDVLKVVPLTDINKSSFIRNKRKVTFREGEYVYFVNIMDYRLKDAVSPISLEKEKIKSIILNIRGNELKKKIRQELYNEANRKQIIETF